MENNHQVNEPKNTDKDQTEGKMNQADRAVHREQPANPQTETPKKG